MIASADAAALITAAGVVLSGIGGGVAFVWNKVDQRFRAIEAKQLQCERRDRRSQRRITLLKSIVEMLLQKVTDLAPNAPILDRAQQLLEQDQALELQDTTEAGELA